MASRSTTADAATRQPHLASTNEAPQDCLPGDRWTGTNLGKYSIIRRLGKGGSGIVYEARDPVLDRRVAIKVLRESIAAQPQAVRRFLREAQTTAKLNHPNVVHVYEADLQNGVCYLVMELMEGGSANDRIVKWGPFGWVEATRVAVDACRGLVAVHAAGLIHRDVKPSNIMRTTDGAVKLADFGLALASSHSAETVLAHGQVVGTPLYMSPEQCRGDRLDDRSDVYSLGATYYTLLTGRPPFDGNSTMQIMTGHCTAPPPDVRAVNPHVPAPCADLIQRCMAKNVAERPASAAALLTELERILAQASNPDADVLEWASEADRTAKAETVPEPETPRMQRRSPLPWVVGFCVVAAGLTFGAMKFLNRPQASTPGKIEPPTTPGNGKVEQPPRTKLPSLVTEVIADGPVASLAFDPGDASSLGWGTDNGIECARDLRTQGELFHARRMSVTQVGFSPDSSTWVCLSEGKLHLRDRKKQPNSKNGTSSLSLPNARIVQFAFHPRQKLIALAFREEGKSSGGIVLRWTDGAYPDLVKPLKGIELPTSFAFALDGSVLLGGQVNGVVRIWNVLPDPDAGLVLSDARAVSVGNSPIVGVAPLDEPLFAVAVGERVYRFDAKAGVVKETICKSDKPILAMAAVSTRLVYAADSLVVVDPRTFREYTRHEMDGVVTALTISRGGNHAAAGTLGGMIFVVPVD